MRGKHILTVLNFIGEGVSSYMELSEAILRGGYGGKRIDSELSKIKKRNKLSRGLANEKKRLSSLLFKLKRDKILAVDSESKRFYLTTRGENKLLELNNLFSDCSLSRNYPVSEEGGYKIVIFDIPERLSCQRIWLRSVLTNLGFKMLQKSVWIGDNKIPKELIKDFSKLKLLDYIEIFEVVKRGSLKIEERE